MDESTVSAGGEGAVEGLPCGRSARRRRDPVLARRAVLADLAAPLLYRELVGEDSLPPRFVSDLDRFEWDYAAIKVNWALDSLIPWTAPGAHGAGTVHLSADLAVYGCSRPTCWWPDPRGPIPAARADNHRRPDPVTSWYRVGVGLHPRAARAAMGRASVGRHVQRIESVVERNHPDSAS